MNVERMNINGVLVLFQEVVKLYSDTTYFGEYQERLISILTVAFDVLNEDELDLFHYLVLNFQDCLFKQINK